mmetsp:Transcript_2419/g.3505  ORF Transcript_2419/g.3505 Transcript_2419/m.3505 type:complete len:536 (-) Transcript_2419:108-1715(-)
MHSVESCNSLHGMEDLRLKWLKLNFGSPTSDSSSERATGIFKDRALPDPLAGVPSWTDSWGDTIYDPSGRESKRVGESTRSQAACLNSSEYEIRLSSSPSHSPRSRRNATRSKNAEISAEKKIRAKTRKGTGRGNGVGGVIATSRSRRDRSQTGPRRECNKNTKSTGKPQLAKPFGKYPGNERKKRKRASVSCFRCDEPMGERCALHMYRDKSFCSESCRDSQMRFDEYIKDLRATIEQTFGVNYTPLEKESLAVPVSPHHAKYLDTCGSMAKVFHSARVVSFSGTRFMRSLGFPTVIIELKRPICKHPLHVPHKGEVIAGLIQWQDFWDGRPYKRMTSPALMCFGSDTTVEVLSCCQEYRIGPRNDKIALNPMVKIRMKTDFEDTNSLKERVQRDEEVALCLWRAVKDKQLDTYELTPEFNQALSPPRSFAEGPLNISEWSSRSNFDHSQDLNKSAFETTCSAESSEEPNQSDLKGWPSTTSQGLLGGIRSKKTSNRRYCRDTAACAGGSRQKSGSSGWSKSSKPRLSLDASSS